MTSTGQSGQPATGRDRRATTARVRLLEAGKALFAEHGYEQTSTSAIARRAGTSESQLVRYFASKRGLLSAIFDESWLSMNEQIQQAAAGMDDPVAALQRVLLRVVAVFDRDSELAHLFLFEGRRVRSRGRGFALSTGYADFVEFLQALVRRGQRAGAFARDIDTAALCSALVGAVEGMMRDRIMAGESGRRSPFSEPQVHRVFSALLAGLQIGPRARKRSGGGRRARR